MISRLSPTLDHLFTGKVQHRNTLDGDAPASSGNAVEFAQMRALDMIAHSQCVSCGDHVVEVQLHVGETGEEGSVEEAQSGVALRHSRR